MDNIGTSSKASSHKLFKNNIRYLSVPLTFILKKTLSCFRCSTHSLMIEKGCHTNIDRDYRFCQYCLNRNVFLMKCPYVRQKYFKDSWLNSVSCERTFIYYHG